MSATKCPKCSGGFAIWNMTNKRMECNKCDYVSKLQTMPSKDEDPIAKAMDRKEVFINKSLDKKNSAIEIAGARRDGTLIHVAILETIFRTWENDEKAREHYNTFGEYFRISYENLDKLQEGYLNEQIRKRLDFDPSQEPEEKINLNNAKF